MKEIPDEDATDLMIFLESENIEIEDDQNMSEIEKLPVVNDHVFEESC